MKRKINRVGTSTLTVSLPSKWAQKYALKPGQEVEVFEEGRIVHISAGANVRKGNKTIINIDEFNALMVNRLLNELYNSGVDEIIINFSKPTVPNYKTGESVEVEKYINRLLPRFIGLEIVSQTPGKIILQNLLPVEKTEKLDVIQKRTYFLIKEFLSEFIKNLNNFSSFYPKVYDYHDAVDRFINYYLRLISASDLGEHQKARAATFYERIKTVLDKVRHTSERLSEMKMITPKIKSYVAEIFNYYMSQFDFIFKSGITTKEVDGIVKKRYELVNKINQERFNEREARVIWECRSMVDTIVEFLDEYIQLNSESFRAA